MAEPTTGRSRGNRGTTARRRARVGTRVSDEGDKAPLGRGFPGGGLLPAVKPARPVKLKISGRKLAAKSKGRNVQQLHRAFEQLGRNIQADETKALLFGETTRNLSMK
jgi:hypothetical protein